MMIHRVVSAIKRRIVARLPRQIVQVPVREPMLMSDLLKGRRALITGGTSGIGLAMAEAFLRSGAEVIITGRSEEKLKTAVEYLKNDKAYGLVLDNTRGVFRVLNMRNLSVLIGVGQLGCGENGNIRQRDERGEAGIAAVRPGDVGADTLCGRLLYHLYSISRA